jgi:DNA-binding transcriptional ArsR family regulator
LNGACSAAGTIRVFPDRGSVERSGTGSDCERLSDGKAMPAGELARAAGVSPQSASAHLQKLVDARVLSVWSQGRFRYYRIVDDDVASLIESLIDLAVRAEKVDRTRARLPAPLCQSRTCYRHLAGQLGVSLSNALIRGNLVAVSDRTGRVTEKGIAWCRSEQIDFRPTRAPHVRLCNDWTERVPHLAGPFPNAILERLIETRCVASLRIPRALRLTEKGRAFFARLGAEVPF